MSGIYGINNTHGIVNILHLLHSNLHEPMHLMKNIVFPLEHEDKHHKDHECLLVI